MRAKLTHAFVDEHWKQFEQQLSFGLEKKPKVFTYFGRAPSQLNRVIFDPFGKVHLFKMYNAFPLSRLSAICILAYPKSRNMMSLNKNRLSAGTIKIVIAIMLYHTLAFFQLRATSSARN